MTDPERTSFEYLDNVLTGLRLCHEMGMKSVEDH